MANLEDVATASVPPGEALRLLREVLANGDGTSPGDAVETAYEALRSVVWQIVSSRSEDPEARGWADVVLRVRQLVRTQGRSEAERLTALYDMLDQTIRFAERRHVRRAVHGKHVSSILGRILQGGGSVARIDLAAATGLKDANLSRILSNLVAEGLVERRFSGREVFLSLTPAGRLEAAGKPRGRVASAGSPAGALVAGAVRGSAARSIVSDLFPSTGASMAVWDGSGSLLASDAGFVELFGGRGLAASEGMSKATFSKALDAGAAPESGEGSMTTGDGRVFRVAMRDGTRGSLWLFTDVTSYAKTPPPPTAGRRIRPPAAVSGSRVMAALSGAEGGDASKPGWAAPGEEWRSWPVRPLEAHATEASYHMFGLAGSARLAFPAGEPVAHTPHASHFLALMATSYGPQHLYAGGAASAAQGRLIRECIHVAHERAQALEVGMDIDSGLTDFLEWGGIGLSALFLQAVCDVVEHAPRGTRVAFGAHLVNDKVVVRATGGPGFPDMSVAASGHLWLWEALARSFGGQFGFRAGKTEAMEATVTFPVAGLSPTG